MMVREGDLLGRRTLDHRCASLLRPLIVQQNREEGAMEMRTKLFSPTIDHFKLWREELGKTEQEIADLAGIRLEEYAAAERASSPAEVGMAFVKIQAAFNKLGKSIPPVTAHSTKN